MRIGGPARQRAALLLAAIGGIALAGCSRTGEAVDAAIARTGDGAIDRDAAAAIESASARLRQGASLPLPADFPQDVYLPPGYDIDSVLDMDDAMVMSLRAPGGVDTLFVDARDAMSHLGWQRTLSRRDSNGRAVLAFEKGPRTAVLSFGRDHDRGDVVIGLQLHERLL